MPILIVGVYFLFERLSMEIPLQLIGNTNRKDAVINATPTPVMAKSPVFTYMGCDVRKQQVVDCFGLSTGDIVYRLLWIALL